MIISFLIIYRPEVMK